MSKATPPLHVRINKLFETNRTADNPEISNAVVAGAVSSLLGRLVHETDIAELRAEAGFRFVDADLVHALAEYFEAPASFLANKWDSTAESYDRELSVLTQLRDSGVQLLAMRDGGAMSAEDLMNILEQLPEQHKGKESDTTGTRSNV
ncbi:MULTISPECIES: hypothetical protein [unclassified Rhodococcus (in: high G+C Gram-positive bacteria)]|uniref:hypothetical protein n=1 Tax=unclassified Rhodococcus (in: high G+C Gram-positive bacteria) TaxID=192944 RepID=UPI000B9C6D54|nr:MULTISPECIES: hypothetical protein [unclassified Rhodococcus (in: high G+C Gram-positive bacteria)]OZE37263.1 hypothetical protein CH259_10170 [Rhodococcus sp. 05-2254-4]OZE45075.1 hypothetical protein CH261_13730 [Rhodococcus sp. 05-2254-3]OZE45389.1 hypothetical protein CH283_23800 [Rhodococcus sp. 05-2254-2]